MNESYVPTIEELQKFFREMRSRRALYERGYTDEGIAWLTALQPNSGTAIPAIPASQDTK